MFTLFWKPVVELVCLVSTVYTGWMLYLLAGGTQLQDKLARKIYWPTVAAASATTLLIDASGFGIDALVVSAPTAAILAAAGWLVLSS